MGSIRGDKGIRILHWTAGTRLVFLFRNELQKFGLLVAQNRKQDRGDHPYVGQVTLEDSGRASSAKQSFRIFRRSLRTEWRSLQIVKEFQR